MKQNGKKANIGLKKMEQAVKGFSYKQMSNVVNWRMSDDNMEKAMADITNYHHKQPYAVHWGDGSTSSSDGVRVKSAVEKLREKEEVNESLLKHISPIGWEHINFIGQYNFDDNSDYNLVDNMRPLRELLQ